MKIPPSNNGRLSNGRFGAGNKEGKGQPFGRRVQELRKVFFDKIDDVDLEQLVDNLLRIAKDPDHDDVIPAAKIILSYTLGNPNTIAPDDGDESIREQLRKMSMQELFAALKSLPDFQEQIINIESKELCKKPETTNTLKPK